MINNLLQYTIITCFFLTTYIHMNSSQILCKTIKFQWETIYKHDQNLSNFTEKLTNPGKNLSINMIKTYIQLNFYTKLSNFNEKLSINMIKTYIQLNLNLTYIETTLDVVISAIYCYSYHFVIYIIRTFRIG